MLTQVSQMQTPVDIKVEISHIDWIIDLLLLNTLGMP